MAGAVDGLVSGLNTRQIISQLMTLERAGQDRLRVKQTETESSISALRSLNARFLNLGTVARATAAPTGWNAATATSSDPTRVSVSAKPGALVGEVNIIVKQLATTEIYKSSGTVEKPESAVALTGSSFSITKDGTTKSVNVGDGTLTGIVAAINAADAGVTATAVQLSPGAYALQLTSSTSGDTALSFGGFVAPLGTLSSPLGQMAEVTAGKDAQLQVGVAADLSGGYSVTRKSNAIDDLLKGTTLVLQRQDPTTAINVKVTSDTAAMADSVAKLVDSVNAALSEISRTAGYDVATRKGGVLFGEGSVRGLRSQLVTAVTGDSGSTPSIAGVSVQRDGTIAFDRAKFLAALAADPEGVRARLGAGTEETVVDGTTTPGVPGLAARLAAVADAASRGQGAAGGTGLLTAAIASRERNVNELKADISRWDNRLTLREERLVAQFARLETALGAAQQQGQWLAGQIAGLPSYGS